jgi:hypothetical protein
MDNIPEGMTLDGTKVRISPLVPSIILDYYMRNWRKQEIGNTVESVEFEIKHNEYTVGVLLGVQIESNIVVTNAFGIKYEKNTKFQKDYVDFMTKYLTKGTKEQIVGMFHVLRKGQDINEYDAMVAYAQMTELAKRKWILLTIDGTLESDSLNMKTFLPLDIDFGETQESLWIFADTPHEVITENLSATGLDTVLYGQESYDTLSVFWRDAANAESLTLDKLDQLKNNQRLFSSGEKLKMNIESISTLLKNSKGYVDAVQSGEITSDTKIDRALNSALSKIAHVTPDSIERLLKDHFQDLLHISKLTNLIKDQLFISHKLTGEIK